MREGKVLLVRHVKPGAYDFLVLPGGGVYPDEDAVAAAKREAWEEAGLDVEPLGLAYVEETQQTHQRECKLWFWCKEAGGGVPSALAYEARREFIVEARFYSRDQLDGKVVFPPIVLTEQFWQDAARGASEAGYLGLRRRDF